MVIIDPDDIVIPMKVESIKDKTYRIKKNQRKKWQLNG